MRTFDQKWAVIMGFILGTLIGTETAAPAPIAISIVSIDSWNNRPHFNFVLYHFVGFQFWRFFSRIPLGTRASHSNHLSNNFVWEMVLHCSLCLSIPVDYWNNGRCNGIGTRLVYSYTWLRFTVRAFNAFYPNISDHLQIIRIFGWCLCQPW